MRIQHNIMAMNAYRNYNSNTSALAKNLEKLSSGYRINRAGDDAAGLAISEKMRAQITGLDAAQKNVKDGVSLVKTAEGAMQEIHDMLGRMKYLATQSANGTYDNQVDRKNLQKEVDSLLSEIDRIADSANFNGQKLLNGELDPMTNLGGRGRFDLPALGSAVGTSTVVHQDAKTAAKTSFTIDLGDLECKGAKGSTVMNIKLGSATIKLKIATAASGDKTATDIANAFKSNVNKGANMSFTNGGKLTIQNGAAASEIKMKYDTGASVVFKVSVNGGKITFEQKDNPTKASQVFEGDWSVSVSHGSGAGTIGKETSVNASTTVNSKGQMAGNEIFASTTFELTENLVVPGGRIKIGNTEYTFVDKLDPAATNKQVQIAYNDKGEIDLKTTAERLTKAAADNAEFSVGYNKDGTGKITITELKGQTLYKDANGKSTLTSVDAIKNAIEWLAPDKFGQGLQLQIGDTSDSYNQLRVVVKDMHTKSKTLDIGNLKIDSAEAAAASIKKIESAINEVSGVRGDLGAIQNRLEHTEKNLSVMQESIQDAESAIRDTDVAAEMMKYTKNNILIQSAQAMLAQANQVPQGVLQLLQ